MLFLNKRTIPSDAAKSVGVCSRYIVRYMINQNLRQSDIIMYRQKVHDVEYSV